ncbi:MAG: pyridoxamine 5'-phosphate oxidase family protein [Spirochaetota bacterium]|nr:pyridoxamine 5'-phosphate oxidase family protein [Spirochaetota bacterium]
MSHTKDQIDDFLRNAFFSVLSFQGSDGLLSQLMIFGHAVDGSFYMISQNEKSIFEPLKAESQVSVLIYKEEENLDDITQLNIQGKATLIKDFTSADGQTAFQCIGEKSPLIASVADDPGSSSNYSVIKVEASVISYITFGELKQFMPPTVLKRS